MDSNFLVRGILIGGSMGALAVSFGIVETSMFVGIGAGIIAGAFAGVTRMIIDYLRSR